MLLAFDQTLNLCGYIEPKSAFSSILIFDKWDSFSFDPFDLRAKGDKFLFPLEGPVFVEFTVVCQGEKMNKGR